MSLLVVLVWALKISLVRLSLVDSPGARREEETSRFDKHLWAGLELMAGKGKDGWQKKTNTVKLDGVIRADRLLARHEPVEEGELRVLNDASKVDEILERRQGLPALVSSREGALPEGVCEERDASSAMAMASRRDGRRSPTCFQSPARSAYRSMNGPESSAAAKTVLYISFHSLNVIRERIAQWTLGWVAKRCTSSEA